LQFCAKPVSKTDFEMAAAHLSGVQYLEGIAFDAWDSPMGVALSQARGSRFHIAGRLGINHWGGRQSVQVRLEDAAPSHQ
ncbi:MAG: single-stranded-DNA-specific exonuclease RecJ, partial [Pseudomonadota bacterium]